MRNLMRAVWASAIVGSTLVLFQNCGEFKSGSAVANQSSSSSSVGPASPQPTPSPSPISTSPSVQLNWDPGATGSQSSFAIEQSNDGTTFTQVTSVDEPARTVTVSGLTSGATYYFRIRALNSAGNSGYSSVVNVTMPAAGSSK